MASASEQALNDEKSTLDQLPVTPDPHSPRPQFSSLFQSIGRILKAVGISLIVFASLMSFPSIISIVAGCWLAAASFFTFRQNLRLASNCLLVLAVILISKYPERSVSFLVFLFVLIGGAWLLRYHPKKTNLTLELVILVGVFFWFAILRWEDASRSVPLAFDKDRPIACLGDSLTDYGYPDELAKLVSVPVLDYGRDGCTLPEAIKDFLPEIERTQPQIVIVELGGHDFKDGIRTRAQIRSDLETIVQRVRSYGGEVVLVEIPRGFVFDPLGGLERGIAKQYDLELISDTIIRRFILFGPNFPPGSWLQKEQQLSDDNLHPNGRGNREFARTVLASLKRVVGPSIDKNDSPQ